MSDLNELNSNVDIKVVNHNLSTYASGEGEWTLDFSDYKNVIIFAGRLGSGNCWFVDRWGGINTIAENSSNITIEVAPDPDWTATIYNNRTTGAIMIVAILTRSPV